MDSMEANLACHIIYLYHWGVFAIKNIDCLLLHNSAAITVIKWNTRLHFCRYATDIFILSSLTFACLLEILKPHVMQHDDTRVFHLLGSHITYSGNLKFNRGVFDNQTCAWVVKGGIIKSTNIMKINNVIFISILF